MYTLGPYSLSWPIPPSDQMLPPEALPWLALKAQVALQPPSVLPGTWPGVLKPDHLSPS